VLMLDISHSMILYGEDRITPAKQVGLALSELIMTKFPRDYIALVVFGDDAKLVSINELPFLNVGPYHTNTRAGLQLARNLLRRCGNVNKQIFMITDGKPSAMFDDAGRLYKNSFGLDPKIVNKTLDEAVACRREKITISTFMVARDPYLINFVEELTKANHGRAYYSSLNNLGQFIFVDYIRNRRKRFSS
jgi:Ca-activated chloride channel homolog